MVVPSHWVVRREVDAACLQPGDVITAEVGSDGQTTYTVHRRVLLALDQIVELHGARAIEPLSLGPSAAPTVTPPVEPLAFGVLRDRRRSPMQTG